jgi:hypothetical protein
MSASQTNLEPLRSDYSQWERGDFGDASWADPQIEFGIADGPSPTIGRGLQSMAATWGEFLASWSEFKGVPERFIELDDVRVLVFLEHEGRGRASGLELTEELAHTANLFHFRDGMVTRLIIYFNRDRALADVGMPPEAELNQDE